MLHYNENKMEVGEAALIMASGFAGEIERMDFNQKLNRFQHLQQLKPDVKTNAVHVSLNFHSSERLGTETLQEIAGVYMEQIGFGDQPFLVYRHDDAAHLHLHIVTTNITAQAERIDLHDIGKRLSEPTRKAIEESFGLIKAESKLFKAQSGIRKADPEKARYGRLPTKQAISNVIAAVSRDYKFTSLVEYNAVLKGFNVVALRGAEHTPMFKNKGLMYSLLDEKGIPVGVPVKASSFYSRATLRNLEQKFEKNVLKRKPFKAGLQEKIGKVFDAYQQISQATFVKALAQNGVEVLFRENEQGRVFGLTFVDHQTKCVFNGSDLGKVYSAKAITERFDLVDRKRQLDSVQADNPSLTESNNPKMGKAVAANTIKTNLQKKGHVDIQDFLSLNDPTNRKGMLEILYEKTLDYGPGIPHRRKKRKKRPVQELGI